MEVWILGGYSGTSDLDLGKKIGSLDWGGYSGTLRFGLRGKIGSLDFGGGILGPSDLDLGGKLEVWIEGVFWDPWIWT